MLVAAACSTDSSPIPVTPTGSSGEGATVSPTTGATPTATPGDTAATAPPAGATPTTTPGDTAGATPTATPGTTSPTAPTVDAPPADGGSRSGTVSVGLFHACVTRVDGSVTCWG